MTRMIPITYPERIDRIIGRVMNKLKDRRCIMTRCSICGRVRMIKPYSTGHINKLCDECLSSYGHFCFDGSTYDT